MGLGIRIGIYSPHPLGLPQCIPQTMPLLSTLGLYLKAPLDYKSIGVSFIFKALARIQLENKLNQ
jgi:hypothetical protein